MTEEQLEDIKYAGLKAVCKKYIEVMSQENPGSWKDTDWRLEYECQETSHNLQGASVGTWFGMPGDQTWSCVQYFSLTASVEWENV